MQACSRHWFVDVLMRADRTGPCFCVGEKEAPRPPFLLQATSTNKDPSIHHPRTSLSVTYPRPHRLRNPPRPITAPIAIPTFPAPPPCCLDIHGLPVTADVSRLPPPARLPWAPGGHSLPSANLYIFAPPRSPARSLPSFLPSPVFFRARGVPPAAAPNNKPAICFCSQIVCTCRLFY